MKKIEKQKKKERKKSVYTRRGMRHVNDRELMRKIRDDWRK